MMDDPRAALIRAKNTAFHALTVALAAMERRRHVTGHALPASWLERLQGLRLAYRRAWLAWTRGRSRWEG